VKKFDRLLGLQRGSDQPLALADANKDAAAARDADLRPILEAMRDRPLREIAMELTNRNIPTPRGGDAWSPVTVMRAMRRLGLVSK
jgi:hypothetical protein